MQKSPMEVFQMFGAALMAGDDSWQDVVADDVKFHGPAAQTDGKAAFAELNAKFMSSIRGNTMHRAVESGDFVITQVALDVEAPTGNTITLEMTEWYEVRDGQIQTIKVYYDAEEFRREFAVQA